MIRYSAIGIFAYVDGSMSAYGKIASLVFSSYVRPDKAKNIVIAGEKREDVCY